MFSLNYTKLSEAEKTAPYTYGAEKNRKILKKIDNALPELLSRNLKRGQELKSKVFVSNFMNHTENKTNKYLTQIVTSSLKRVKDIKTGLSLNRVVKKATKKLGTIYNNINKDFLIKNKEFILNERKLIDEKIEDWENDKINELINKIKYSIHPVKLRKKPESHSIAKSIPEEEMSKIKDIISNQFLKDANLLKNKINSYKKNLLTLAESNSTKFFKLSNDMNLNTNLKMINYSKPSFVTFKEKKNLNVLKIRKLLSKSYREKEKNEINRTYKNIDNKNENTSSFNKNETMIVLKNLAKDKKSLEIKTNYRLKRINSMVDIKLPFYSNYHRTIKYCKKLNNLTAEMERNEKKKKIEFKFKKGDSDKIKIIKDEINNLTQNKIKEKYNELIQKLDIN